MAKMKDSELLTILTNMEADAVVNQKAFIAENEELLRRYKAEPYGTEVPGRSQVVSQDVQDIVESDMPSLVRTFLGSDEIFNFIPSSDNPRDVEEAEEKTRYVDWIVRKQPWSFRVNHGFLKDCSLQKMGVIKYFFEKTETTEEVSFKNITEHELAEIEEDLKAGGGVREVIDIKKEPGEPVNSNLGVPVNTLNLTFRVKITREEIKMMGVPTESFLVSQNSSDVDDAAMVGDSVSKTRGQLLAEGIKKDVVKELRQVSGKSGNNTNTMTQIRFDDEGGMTENQFRTWSNELVEISDLYVKIDFDGDGIAERRHIQKSGDAILVNEAFDHVPYAVASGILMPHKAIGRSRAQLVTKTAEVKTALTRQMLDNGYMANNPKLGINDNVDLDDALDYAIGGVVRMDDDGNPGDNIFPIVIPFVADKTLLMIQYMDQTKAQSVGNQLASQGLNADQLNKETATRFEGVKDENLAKIELVARVIAETGYRKLYEGIAWTASRFQTTEREFMVLGKPLRSNPAKWKFDHKVDSEVGLGAGDSDKVVANMTGLWNIQQVLKGQGSPLVDAEKEFNTLSKMTKGLDIKDVSKHFNDPNEPDELLMAQNEALNKAVLQMQEQLQASQNPLAEAEMVKREGDVAIAEGNLDLKAAQLLEDRRQFDVEQGQNAVKQQEATALKLTELELTHKEDVPGSIV